MRLVPASKAIASDAKPVAIPTMEVGVHAPRILDFDIENRPLSYLGNDWTSAEITAIAWSWDPSDVVEVVLLGPLSEREMLEQFVKVYDEADIVTGHYIRKHDLPMINGMMTLEHHMPPLGKKNTIDTKNDLTRRKDLSASQENLSAIFDLPEPKHHMNQSEWRSANRLTPEGLEKTRKRVTDDIVQHKALRAKLTELGLLGPPRLWWP